MGWNEKWTLRFAVVALIFLAMTGFEGVLMRTYLSAPQALEGFERAFSVIRVIPRELTPADYFYSMMTVHPIVGVYGFAYMAVMGAFYFLVPYLLKKEIRHRKLVPLNFWLQTIGVLTCWASGFFLLFNSLYTLYWPLPVSFDRVPLSGTIAFTVGAAMIMVNILLFSFNIFSTVLSKSNPQSYTFGQFFRAAFGISRLMRLLGKEDKTAVPLDYNGLPVFIVAVARGSIDTVINAVVLLTAGALILIYGLATLFGHPLNPMAVDALVYKNWFWWGLDMVADGNVLIYTAGVWYLLIPLLVGRQLYGEPVVRTVIMADLLISLGVWSHHLLGDRVQPLVMRLLSGQFITWGEFITMGLTIFASLMTIWKAQPVKITPPLLFILGSIFGFIMGGTAGLIQANVGLNLVLHNTQWVIMTHAHTMLLTGLSNLLFAVVYALVPMLTGKEIRSRALTLAHFWFWTAGSVLMTYVMGLAGAQGMLRRMLYPQPNIYQPFLDIAWVGGILMTLGFLAFLINIIATIGWDNLLRLVVERRPAASAA
ncbi:MAG: cbb3-type cytochrome c oxidase subunit I [Anaerolineae bacterium]|nr:cbb3-type cytochrome c oxidase subunit I [Anaerolineae bacterium]MDW8102467.1 cbb3-type cytochrome c oxidase subunit I [Anaerolineae bacterium]